MSQITVVGFNGSPRKYGNTARMIRRVFTRLEAAGIQTQEIQIGGNRVRGCIACGMCHKKNLGHCVFDDDPMNGWIEAMKAADGVILGSPTYFANVSTEMKALIDRGGFSAMHLMRRKVGAPVVAVRRGGAIQVYNAMMAFFGISQMIVPCSSYWNMGFGLNPGEVENDAEGLRTMDNLGDNMAFVLQKLKS